jgi:hypothetical protein
MERFAPKLSMPERQSVPLPTQRSTIQGDETVFSKLTQRPIYLVLFLTVLVVAACGGASTTTATPIPIEEPAVAPTAVEEPTATSTPISEASSGGQDVGEQHTYVIVPEESKASYVVDEEFFADALSKYGIQAGLTDTIGGTQETEFTATAIEDTPATYQEGDEVQFKLVGDLTIREITQPATFDVTANLEGDTITGVATAQLLMTDFGIDPPNFANTLTVQNEFAVQVEFTAREQ